MFNHIFDTIMYRSVYILGMLLVLLFVSPPLVLADEQPLDNPSAFEKGLVTFTFDDGYASVYEFLSGGGLGDFPGTLYMVSTYLIGATEGGGVYYTGYMTLDNLAELYGDGHEVGAHTRNHISGGLLTNNERSLLFETSGSRLDLLRFAGFRDSIISSIAYPFGEFNNSLVARLKSAGFSGARTVDSSSLNDRSTNPFELYATQINLDSTLGEVKSKIDAAIEEKKWLIFVIHEVEEDCGVEVYCTTPDFLKEIVGYLENKNGESIDVITMTRGLELMGHYSANGPQPTITRGNVIVHTDNPEGGAIVDFTPVVSDSSLIPFCTTSEEVEYQESGVQYKTVVVPGDSFPFGTTNVTCAVINQAGHIGEHQFAIVVTDKSIVTVEVVGIDKVYDGTRDALVTLNVIGAVEGDGLTATGEAVFATKDAGHDIAVEVKNITLVGVNAENYILGDTTATSSADIAPLSVTVEAAADDKEWDKNTDATVTLTLVGTIEGDKVSVQYDSADFDTAEVGINKVVTITGVRLSGDDARDYELSNTGTVTAMANITPKKEDPAPPKKGGSKGSAKVSNPNTPEDGVLDATISVPKQNNQEGVTIPSVQYQFLRNLKIGSTGNDVTELQKRLTEEGAYGGPITGYFGPLTSAGVRAYQLKHGIDPVGVLGPITRGSLNASVSFDIALHERQLETIAMLQTILAQLLERQATLRQ